MSTAKKKPARGAKKDSSTFSAEERAAMRDAARERKSKSKDGEADLLAKIAEMPPADRALAERLHALVRAHAPTLAARTWYGMPAYARDGEVVCFFQNAAKFKTRYATLGFSDKAALDEGAMWPTSFALKELTPEVESRIVELVKRAAG